MFCTANLSKAYCFRTAKELEVLQYNNSVACFQVHKRYSHHSSWFSASLTLHGLGGYRTEMSNDCIKVLSAKPNATPYPIFTCRYETNISNPTWYSDDTGLELIPRQFDPSKDEPVAGKNYFFK